MGTGSSTTFVKWKLWIPWLFGRGFLCRCSFDVDLNTALAVEAGFGPFWVEPLRVCVILHGTLYSACQSIDDDGMRKKVIAPFGHCSQRCGLAFCVVAEIQALEFHSVFEELKSGRAKKIKKSVRKKIRNFLTG